RWASGLTGSDDAPTVYRRVTDGAVSRAPEGLDRKPSFRGGLPEGYQAADPAAAGGGDLHLEDADQEGPGAQSSDNSMERTRFFRRPVVWIILVIIGAIVLSSFFTSGPSYQRVDTSVAQERLN